MSLGKNIFLRTMWVLFVSLTSVTVLFLQNTDETVRNVLGNIIWTLLYIIFPIFILILPFVLKYFFQGNKKIISLAALFVYIGITVITPIGVNRYIRIFTPAKWEKYRNERIMMLEDFNIKYNIKEMTKEEIKNLLGEPHSETENEIEYFVSDGWVDPEMLVFRFENQVLAEEYIYSEFKSNKTILLK